jgi:hypothetical protein
VLLLVTSGYTEALQLQRLYGEGETWEVEEEVTPAP